MGTALLVIAMALLLGLTSSAPALAQKATTPPKAKTTAKAPAKKKVTTTKKTPARKPVRRTRRTVARRAAAPQNQRVPTKERYAEIQQALIDAGYFVGQPNGIWQQDSIDALRAFQYSSGFEPTGKIDARSLIKLGLGPTYGATTTPAPSGDTREPG